MITMFRFASPYFFALLILIPLLVYFRRRRVFYPPMGLPDLSKAKTVKASPALRMAWIIDVLKYGALCLMIVALARPQWGVRQVSVLTEGVNIVLAVDTSESMAALDFRREGKIVNRLEAVKSVVARFVTKRYEDRIGLVVFGSQAYTQVPLTRDYTTITSILDRVKIGAAGPMTAIGDAIGISLKRLEDIRSASNIIILLTDGESNAGELSPQAASEVASLRGVRIYTIGVGSTGRAPFLIQDPLLGERYVERRVTMDEEGLKDIARKTEGLYFNAKDSETLQEIYDTIDQLEKTEVRMKHFAEYRELYRFLLIPALVMILLWSILVNTRYVRVP